MRCWIALLAVAACRYGFDPIDVPDAAKSSLVPPDHRVACHDAACFVDCSTWPSCEVDCGQAALACVVRCPETGCTVTSCTTPDCDVLCGTDLHEATYLATTATCP